MEIPLTHTITFANPQFDTSSRFSESRSDLVLSLRRVCSPKSGCRYFVTAKITGCLGFHWREIMSRIQSNADNGRTAPLLQRKKILNRISRFITRKMLLIHANEVSARFARM